MNSRQVIFSKDDIKKQWKPDKGIEFFKQFMEIGSNQLSISQMQNIFDVNEPKLTALLGKYMECCFSNPEIKAFYFKNFG
jgi:hypothetical protein